MKPKQKNKSRLSGLLRMAAPQKGKLILSCLLAVIGEGFGIVPFFVIYKIIAEVASTSLSDVEQRFIYTLIAFGILAIILKHACLGVSTALSHVSAYNILYDLRVAIAQKLRTLSLGYFNKKNTGQIKKVMSEDVEQMEIFLAHNIPDFTAALFYTLLTAIVLFVVDWRLALATVLAIPAGMVIQMMTMRSGREFINNWFLATEKMNAAMIEYIQGMSIIKAFNHTVESFSKYSGSIEDCLRLEDQVSKRWYLPTSIFSVSITANMLLLLPVGAAMYLAGMITLGKFVFFLLMGVGFGSPMWVMIQFGRFMEKHLESQARIDAVLTAKPLSEPDQPETPGKDIFGNSVEFGYNRQNKVIDGIDFSIPARKFVALVGPSGAGKTTLARLIPRFWDVEAGSITLGETDIRNIKTDDLMDKFGLIFQNVYLFNDTVLANLKLGNADASEAKIVDAAKKARCHEFIMKLPSGYDTVIGEKGARISGGEKQRLSIARALLNDEATAFIDPENEALVQDAINKLVRNKTLVVIAHRISTIIAADEIVVLDKGRIAASGTHEQLLADSELYKSMWETHITAQSWSL
jgi:ATP-binding cassette subfamily B protein